MIFGGNEGKVPVLACRWNRWGCCGAMLDACACAAWTVGDATHLDVVRGGAAILPRDGNSGMAVVRDRDQRKGLKETSRHHGGG